MSKYSQYVENLKDELSKELKIVIDSCNYSNVLKQSMSYTLLNHGKMFRGTLLLALLDDLSGDYKAGINAATAIEMIHAYGLIHDDMPALDDARFRRNKLANHLVYGEAQAMLAGDALQAEAFGLVASTPAKSDVVLKLISLLSRTSGANGYVGGQSLDIISEHEDLEEIDSEMIKKIHYGKTGALIEAAVLSAAYLGEVDSSKLEVLKVIAYHVGLAFQIRDDILDVTKAANETGKDARSDIKKDKTTYPKLFGVDKSIVKFQNHLNKSLDLIGSLIGNNSHTSTLVKEMLTL